ncbi:thioredoxin family protein, partial [Planctomycetota bacterium]
ASANIPAIVPGTGRPRLVDLGATECIPCKKMAPILDELKAEYTGRMDVDFIDVWQPENQAQAEIYGIQSIPTQVFLDPNSQELWRHVGFISKGDILAKWHEFGYDLHP